MSSRLSKSTKFARKGVVVFIIFAILTFVLQFAIDLFEQPTPDPVNPDIANSPYISKDQALGNIPKPEVKSLQLTNTQKTRYGLDERGRFDVFPPVVNVYQILAPREQLGNTAKARTVAARLGLPEQEVRIADDILFFESAGVIRSLQYDKVLDYWKYKVNLAKEFIPLDRRDEVEIIPNQSAYSSTGKSMLNTMTLSNEYFSKANSDITFISLTSDNKIQQVIDSKTADFVRIAQYKQIEAATLRPEYRPRQETDPTASLLADIRKINMTDGVANFIVRGDGTDLAFSLIDWQYTEFKYGEKGIYEIITPLEAWNNIQAGQGHLVYLNLLGKDKFASYSPLDVLEFTADTARTQLIYIEPEKWIEAKAYTHYLQPFYMFQGIATLVDGRQADFIILAEPIKSQYYINSITTTPVTTP